jgi:hypothetical protein
MASSKLQPSASSTYDPSSQSQLKYACLFPKHEEYATLLNLFPGNNAHAPWGTEGAFSIAATVIVDGKPVGRLESKSINEKENIRLCFDDLSANFAKSSQGICLIDLYHAKEIPVEVYLSHVHRETGVYIAYPALSFVGDQLYPKTHTHQLENTLFWPGVLASEHVQPCIAILNPYEVPMSFQVHLVRGDGSKDQTKVLQLKPHTSKTYALEMLFPKENLSLYDPERRTSLCVAAQYKVVTYMVLRDRSSGIISTIDHLHAYCLH